MSTANLSRTDARDRSAHLRVTDYRVSLDLTGAVDPDHATFPTTTTVRFTATTGATFLDFLGPVVHSVVLNGSRLDPGCFDGARIHLEGLAEDNVVTVEAEGAYSRSGEGLHRFVDPVDGETYLYTQYEPADARRVFANFEQPDLKARFVLVVTAPSGWTVLSNQDEIDRHDDDVAGATWHTFAPTPPLSTYLTAVVAGPYHRVEGSWRGARPDGGPLEVPLGVLCRASLAEHLDADRVLDVTRQGLAYYHQVFGFPYPWGKYDQVFVPEYNLGAMENPGCVTFTESYVFRSAATRAQHQGRANTILHEMAHMWFGDLVTPQWWDDLWLKESFADYMGAHVSAEATEFTDAWVAFASRRKAWAYLQDQLPTTHPVVADITDLEAAKQNFDGITYAKGASVLKQLVAYVGLEQFFAGARTYFARHAYASTTLPDLLTELEAASGRELGEWSRVWLQTAGTSTLTPRLEISAEGTIGRLDVEQESVDPVTGEQVLRPHRLAVGLYHRTSDGRLRRTHRLELDVAAAVTEVTAAAGLPAPDLVLVNDDDLTYAKTRLDASSLATVRHHLGELAAPLARSLVWSALWNATRDALLPAQEYIAAVLRHAEPDTAVLQGLTVNAGTAVERYLPPAERPAGRAQVLEGAWHHLHAATPGSDAQLVWARALARAGAVVPAAADRLRALLDGSHVVDGLPLDPELRWALWQAVAATGHAEPADLDAELARDHTADGLTQHLAARTARPEPDVRARAWSSLIETDTLTNDQVDATIAGFTQPWAGDLGYVEPYFAAVRQVWQQRSIEIAGRLVRGLYPAHQDAQPDQDIDDHPVVRRTAEWLAANTDAPAGLRRILLEEHDHLRRALRAQQAAGG